MEDFAKVKVGLGVTGHYSYNLLVFLLDKGLPTYVINTLYTNLYRKSLSLRQTKTDKVDARTIASMLMSDVNLKPYSNTSYHNEELKSLTHYNFNKVKERAKPKTSISRLISTASQGHYTKDTATMFREAARTSIGSNMPAIFLELKHTIKLIHALDSEIGEIENEISSPILSIPRINYRMGAMIL